MNVAAQLRHLCGADPCLVAVDGCGGAGKTTLAARWADEVDAQVVALDGFTRPGTPTWEHGRFVREIVDPLRAGRVARYRPWRYDQTEPGLLVEVVPQGIVIVEGVSALAAAGTELAGGPWWDIAVWVDVGPAERRRRIIYRDAPVLLPTWENDWWPSEQAYIEAENPQARADLVVTAPLGSPPRT